MARRIAARIFLASIPLITSFSWTKCSEVKTSFSPKEFRSFPITKIHEISHNTKQFTVALPSEEHTMGARTASCIMIKGNNGPDGKPIIRPYTPTTLDSHKGSFDLVVKSYPEGNVSKYLHSLKVGDSIEVKGPFPKIEYKPNMKKSISMVAGGTGITPMLQIIQEVLNNPADKTELVLIYANNTPEDILLKNLLDGYAKKHKNFKVVYVVSDKANQMPKKDVVYSGYVTKDVLTKHLFPKSDDTMVFVCGPPPMMKAISGDKGPNFTQGEVTGLLRDLEYGSEHVYKF